MLTKRQEREKRLAIRTFIYGVVILMTLFLPNARLGEIYFSGLELIFGDISYQTLGIIELKFSMYNFFMFFLPIIAGTLLISVDRAIKYEHKIRFWVSIGTSTMFLISIIMFFLLPSQMNIFIGGNLFDGLIQLYMGPFIAFVFMTIGFIASLLYLYQEIKIHRIIR